MQANGRVPSLCDFKEIETSLLRSPLSLTKLSLLKKPNWVSPVSALAEQSGSSSRVKSTLHTVRFQSYASDFQSLKNLVTELMTHLLRHSPGHLETDFCLSYSFEGALRGFKPFFGVISKIVL